MNYCFTLLKPFSESSWLIGWSIANTTTFDILPPHKSSVFSARYQGHLMNLSRSSTPPCQNWRTCGPYTGDCVLDRLILEESQIRLSLKFKDYLLHLEVLVRHEQGPLKLGTIQDNGKLNVYLGLVYGSTSPIWYSRGVLFGCCKTSETLDHAFWFYTSLLLTMLSDSVQVVTGAVLPSQNIYTSLGSICKDDSSRSQQHDCLDCLDVSVEPIQDC